MDFERTLEAQRLKLLRIVAGLFVVVGVLSVGPVSRGFSIWVCGFVGSILSRAEAAARCLVFAQVGSLIARSGMDLDRSRFSECLARVFIADDADVSLPDYRGRLKVLRTVLTDLPSHAARLIRRIQKHMRRMNRACRPLPRPDRNDLASLRVWTLTKVRIERPPDKWMALSGLIQPPPETRAGGKSGSPVRWVSG